MGETVANGIGVPSMITAPHLINGECAGSEHQEGYRKQELEEIRLVSADVLRLHLALPENRCRYHLYGEEQCYYRNDETDDRENPSEELQDC